MLFDSNVINKSTTPTDMNWFFSFALKYVKSEAIYHKQISVSGRISKFGLGVRIQLLYH